MNKGTFNKKDKEEFKQIDQDITAYNLVDKVLIKHGNVKES